MLLRRVIDVHVEETFGSTCTACRRTAEFTRFTEVEHSRVFGLRGPKTGFHSHRVRCGSCGHEHHVRDLATLDSPALSQQYVDALRRAIGELDLGVGEHDARRAAIDVVGQFEPSYGLAELESDRSTAAPDELDRLLLQLRDNCHVSIHRHWLAAVIHLAALGSGNTDVVDRAARVLALSNRDVANARLLGTDDEKEIR